MLRAQGVTADDGTKCDGTKQVAAKISRGAHNILGAERDSCGMAILDFCRALHGDAICRAIYSWENPGVHRAGEPSAKWHYYSRLRVHCRIYADGPSLPGSVH